MYWFLNKQLLGEENDKKTRAEKYRTQTTKNIESQS
jgi:hypothetical protein